ncbi:MAG TPA: hypothetical protein VIJ95_09710 [Hanamia sp.]
MNIVSVEILTNNLDETEKFYTQHLSLGIKDKTENTISFSVRNSELIFREIKSENPVYHLAINIPCNKINDARNWLAERVDIISVDENNDIANFTDWNAKSVYFFDNNGNILELIARFDLLNSENEMFCNKSFICISECGIATDDANELTERIISVTKLPVFSKQKRRDDFSALGDDNGLLILSDTKRKWYPTNTKVDKFFIKIKIETSGKKTELIFNDDNSYKN